MKTFGLVILVFFLSGCAGAFEMTIVRKDVVESYKEYVECKTDGCPPDGFIEVTRPKCYRLGFSDLGGELLECVPKKVWDRTTVGEVWHSESMKEKSRE